jgi:hypothetical protein
MLFRSSTDVRSAMFEKHKRNVPSTKAKEAKGDRQDSRTSAFIIGARRTAPPNDA